MKTPHVYRVTDVKITKLARDYVGANPNQTKYDSIDLFGSHDDPHYTVLGAFGESARITYRTYIAKFGLLVDVKNDTLSFTDDTDVLELMRHLADIFHLEYDNIDIPSEPSLWEFFGLGGDDDVDYFGGYIYAVTDAIQLWIDTHPA